MTIRDRILVGAMAGAGIAWGARQVLRLTRRITLEDRVVIVTGASSGHGLMVARYAAQRARGSSWPRATPRTCMPPRSR